MTRHRTWYLPLAVLATCSGIVTFLYFSEYPAITSGQRGPPAAGLLLVTLLMLIGSAPIVLGAALACRRGVAVAAAKVHAAAITAFVVVVLLTFERGHSSPSDSLAGLSVVVLFAIVAVELLLLGIATTTLSARAEHPGEGPPFLFTGLLASLLLGWGGGVLAWSEWIPSKVQREAEIAAGGRAYCLEVGGRPVRERRDLIGLRMHAPNDGGWAYRFHGLLVIEQDAAREYMNWSYRSGRFEPVSDRARRGLHLDEDPRCRPEARDSQPR